MLRRRARKLNGKIAVSKPAKEFASKYIPGHYDIIPNGIDIERFYPDVSPIEEFCDGKLNILFVGRLEQQKGLSYLLKAYKRVKKEIPASRLIVVGPGTRLRSGYEKQAIRDGLSDVVFVGGKSQEELPSYYKTADIFCAPATGLESFGIVLLEAMAVAKPVVATNIKGYASVLTHGREGLLVPPRDDAELAEALLRLAGEESLRQEMGQKGLITAKNYSWERIAQTVVAYYNRILSDSQSQNSLSEYEISSISA
jgi:phosphatidylinositol alpha-mannosyltransferase